MPSLLTPWRFVRPRDKPVEQEFLGCKQNCYAPLFVPHTIVTLYGRDEVDPRCRWPRMTASATDRGMPTTRRSRWFAPRPSDWDLAYLGWGVRYYGLRPAAEKRIEGWSFQLVRSGNPILLAGHSTLPAAPGDLFVFADASRQGWTDKRDRRCEVLVWIWKSPPRCAECAPPPAGYLTWKLSSKSVRQLGQIHAQCRQEVAHPDALTPLALDRLRLGLELCLGRLRQSTPSQPSESNRLDLAIQWMRQNLSVRRPVAYLCDYLQVSAHWLEQLFLHNVGELPSSYFQRLKMEQAAQLLEQERLSVKEIAFTLGYAHAHDFSRAFRTYTGKTPEEKRKSPRPPNATSAGKRRRAESSG